MQRLSTLLSTILFTIRYIGMLVIKASISFIIFYSLFWLIFYTQLDWSNIWGNFKIFSTFAKLLIVVITLTTTIENWD